MLIKDDIGKEIINLASEAVKGNPLIQSILGEQAINIGAVIEKQYFLNRGKAFNILTKHSENMRSFLDKLPQNAELLDALHFARNFYFPDEVSTYDKLINNANLKNAFRRENPDIYHAMKGTEGNRNENQSRLDAFHEEELTLNVASAMREYQSRSQIELNRDTLTNNKEIANKLKSLDVTLYNNIMSNKT